nr:MAG TPA: hypothetical protein [Caudoviricetes sp.]
MKEGMQCTYPPPPGSKFISFYIILYCYLEEFQLFDTKLINFKTFCMLQTN